MNFEHKHLLAKINGERVLSLVGSVADGMHRECYAVGGYVRDIFLERVSADIDFVTVGSGIELARAVSKQVKGTSRLSVYKTYGTARLRYGKLELEFVGARRESYRRESRNPIVEDGTLEDDQLRRDFTINALAVSLNKGTWGKLLDPFDGMNDLKNGIVRTPRDPDVTFSDDPLRMLRAVRFATQLQFSIHPTTMSAMKRNAPRIKIITHERIATELQKIMCSTHPSRGFRLLDEAGLLKFILPELERLKGVDTHNGRAHKDNFAHTMQVLENVASSSDNEWLRWAALFHDIGKPATKRWDDQKGWTFSNHNFVGEKMIPRIFARLKLPLDERMKYVKKLVGLHMRPIALVEDIVTDSAVRRMLFEAGDDVDDLMALCKADITSKNKEKVRRFRSNFELVKQKLIDIEEKDRVRNFQPPVDGKEIMETFALKPCKEVGLIKDAIKDAILDGEIGNDYAQAHDFMLARAEQVGVLPANSGQLIYESATSPVGTLTIAATVKGIALIHIAADRPSDAMEPVATSDEAMEMVMQLASAKGLVAVEQEVPLIANCMAQLDEYFKRQRKVFSLPLDQPGTPFRLAVWDAMRRIPYGSTVTYSELASLAGSPKASRAVASACRANNVPIVVPCHRVVPAANPPGEYSAGMGKATKIQLLELERG